MNDGHAFVGRRRELEALATALRHADEGHGSFWLVRGDPGIGKSTLVTRFAATATSTGARVLWGRSQELQGAPPYWPWSQLLRPLVHGQDPGPGRDPDLGQAPLPAGGPDRDLLAPIVALPGEVMPPSRRAEVDRERFYLFDAVARLLRAAAGPRPLVLILEDLHAADPASLLLAEFVATELTGARVLLVATSRPLPVASSVPTGGGAAASLDVLRSARRLLVQGLDRHEVAQLLHRWRLPDETVAAVWERTGGNPFLATETALSIVTHQRSGAGDAPQHVLPDGARQMLLERWRGLTPPTQEVLAVAAVTGTHFPLGALSLCGDLSEEQVTGALHEAVEGGLLARPPVDLGRYRFTHDLLREVIVAALTPERRMRLHGDVGTALVQWYGPNAADHLDELARHFLVAAPVGYRQEAVDLTVRAGQRAMAKLAYEQGGELFDQALRLVQASAPVDASLVAELEIATGHAWLRSGRPDQAKASFLAAAEHAEHAGLPDLVAEAALGYGGQWSFTGETADATLVRLLQAALEGLAEGRHPELRVRLLARLAVELFHSSDWERSVQHSADAVVLARELGDPAALGRTLLARLFTLWRPSSPHHLEERLALDAEVLQLATSTGNAELEMDARAWRVSNLLEAGDLVGAAEQVAAFTRLASQLRQPFYLWFVEVFAAMRALMRGRYQQAQQHADAALAVGRHAQGERELLENAVGAHVIQTLLIRREHGFAPDRPDRVVPTPVDTVLDRFPHQPAWRAAAALRLLATGEASQARGHYDVLAAGGFRALLMGETSLIAFALTAELAAVFGDAGQIAHLQRLLVPFAGRHVVIGHPAMAYQGCVDFYLGLLAAAGEDLEPAVSHLEEASRLHAGMGATPWVARSRYHLARVRHRRDAPGDRDAVVRLLDDVERTADELALAPLGAEVAALRRSAHEEASPAEPEPGPAVFAPDGEVWTVRLGSETVRVRDAKGMHYLHRLLAEPGREFHVLDLAGSVAGRTVTVGGALADGLRPDTGDAGPLLDQQAKRAYRARLEQLRADEAEAEAMGHSERAALAREEIHALAGELARAVGLGGRDRRAASRSERARVNVSRAIRAATDRIGEHAPSLGHHLDTTVRTGAYCAYLPDPQAAPQWVLTLD